MQEKQIYISQKSILFLLDQLAEQFDNELQRKQRETVLLVRQYILNASGEHCLISEQPDLIDSIPKVNDTVKSIVEKEPEAITLDISDTSTEEDNH